MEIWSRRGVTDRFIFRVPEDDIEEPAVPGEAFDE
jgi:hypothetical protein